MRHISPIFFTVSKFILCSCSQCSCHPRPQHPFFCLLRLSLCMRFTRFFKASDFFNDDFSSDADDKYSFTFNPFPRSLWMSLAIWGGKSTSGTFIFSVSANVWNIVSIVSVSKSLFADVSHSGIPQLEASAFASLVRTSLSACRSHLLPMISLGIFLECVALDWNSSNHFCMLSKVDFLVTS